MLFALSFMLACMSCRDSSSTVNWSRCLSSCGGSALLPLSCCCSFLQATTARGFTSASALKKDTHRKFRNHHERSPNHVPLNYSNEAPAPRNDALFSNDSSRVCSRMRLPLRYEFRRGLDDPCAT